MYTPPDILTNEDIASLADPAALRQWVARNRWCAKELGIDTVDDRPLDELRAAFARYIGDRIGIRERRAIDRTALLERRPSTNGIHGSHLGSRACESALADAAVDAADVDAIICGTSSPERIYPTTAVEIQGRIGADAAYAFDLLAACSSFVYGLQAARGLIAAGVHRRVLVVSAEYFTSAVDYADPNNSFFWGDAAAAALVESSADARGKGGYAILDTDCISKLSQNIRTGLGGTKPFLARMGGDVGPASEAPDADHDNEAAYPYFWQDGRSVFREVVPLVVSKTRDIVERNDLHVDQIAQFMFHQPSALLLGGVAKRVLGETLPSPRVPTNFDRFGNTSSCGAPLCLTQESTMQAGDYACLSVFGAGYTVATALLQKIAPR
jgi:3-oxoacyl-(acyl-carrier-protein) synthase III